ncbi:MAG: type I glyceraldehyde-3-phosphate dehydrogenase [Clostridiales bacterium]|nr:type I glyceraldehyde-3-phosphate dehydrogenase [Clostridiales bacterium]
MAIKVGINGFGRIGKVVLRILMKKPEKFEVCGINLRKADLSYMVYMIKYDSVFGRFDGTVEEADNAIIVNGKRITVFSEEDPSKIKWSECGAEYIIESTGAFNTTEKASAHFIGGAKKVILTAPAKDNETPTFVMGVNQNDYKPNMKVVSNASCTTNCLAPLVKVINDAFGIEQGLMSTIHAATAKQKAVDARAGRDWRTGRSVFNNIIPSSTGAAKACALVIPELKGKLTGMSFRVPCNDVSVVDLTARLKTKTTYDDICKVIRAACESNMRGIMSYTKDEIVSSDLKGDYHTCIFDEKAGIMLDDNFVKLLAWYDNEWGYSNKVVDLVELIATEDTKAEAEAE